MSRWFPDALVTGYETLIDGMTNDPKDRHVLAATVRANAEVLVTFNTSDFPEPALQAVSYRREPTTVSALLVRLERAGVPRFAAEVRRHL